MWKPAVRKKKKVRYCQPQARFLFRSQQLICSLCICALINKPPEGMITSNELILLTSTALSMAWQWTMKKKNCLSFLSVSCGRQQEGCVFCQCNWNTQANWVRHLHYTHILPIVWNQRNITLTQWWRFIMCFGYSPGDTLDPNNTG